ncbi:hypothetical protein Tco_1089660 [Tanacetum coccineum]
MAKGNDISKAKACMLAKAQASDAFSKAKVQACGSKTKLQTSGSKTFRVKIPPTMAYAEQKKEKRKISRRNKFYLFMNFEIIVLSSDSSYDRKEPSKASVPIFEGPSIQGLLDWYGYNTIEEYLSWNYFSSTDKDITDKDCIHESNYTMSKANVTTWDENVNKIEVRKSKSCADKAKGKRKHSQASICSLHLQARICSLHLQHAFASKHLELAFVGCIGNLHLHLAFEGCLPCILHLQLAFAGYIGNLHLQLAFAFCICRLHLQASICSLHLQLAFAGCIDNLHLHLAFEAFALLCNKNLLCCKLLQQPFATSICFIASYCNKHWQQAFAISFCFAASYRNKHLLQVFALMQATATSICSKHLLQVFALMQATATSICYKYLVCCKHLHLVFALQLPFSPSI